MSGISGYLVTWRVYVEIGPAGYALFSVFWAALFLIVGILFGLQQESTRAVAHESDRAESDRTQGGRSSLWRFAAVVAVVIAIVVLAVSPIWAPLSLGPANTSLAFVVAVGAGLNALVATMSGVFAGAGMWRQLAAAVAIDGVLRAVLVLGVLAVTHSVFALAVAVVLPFPLSLLIVGVPAARRLLAAARVSDRYRGLAANAARTMLAASATAVLITGFPLVLSFFAGPANHRLLGSLVLAVTLTRAPVLVPLMALSSYLISRFSRRPEQSGRLVITLLVGLGAAVAVMCAAAWLWGVAVMHFVFGAQYDLGAGILVALIASSGLIGALFVSGSAMLALDAHGLYAVGWVAASVVSVGLLFVPLPLPERAALALAAGPAVGLVIHLAGLRVAARRRGAAAAAASSSPGTP